MSTYCIQFMGTAGDVLDTQYVNANSEYQAKQIAFRKSKIRDWAEVVSCKL